MFDIAWSEMIVIGAVALIAIGPKDLPRALRTVGAMTAKARRMATEFQDQFREAMREADLDGVKEEMAKLNSELSSMSSGIQDDVNSINKDVTSPYDPPAVTDTTASVEAKPGELSVTETADPAGKPARRKRASKQTMLEALAETPEGGAAPKPRRARKAKVAATNTPGGPLAITPEAAQALPAPKPRRRAAAAKPRAADAAKPETADPEAGAAGAAAVVRPVPTDEAATASVSGDDKAA